MCTKVKFNRVKVMILNVHNKERPVWLIGVMQLNCCSASTSRVPENLFSKMTPGDISFTIGKCWLFTILQIRFLLFNKFGVQDEFVILIRFGLYLVS